MKKKQINKNYLSKQKNIKLPWKIIYTLKELLIATLMCNSKDPIILQSSSQNAIWIK